ncbi:guanine nucleotide-binding protein subunit gamma 1-like isoform X2 [Phalaenopsis equestris]|uniref:guanine nucleotide-binding protein subunit gamma 1-like isoform X2 n=1 Tax=Phalaenopsis equestris TaxID=78828 RepID=UPI0009E62632|nr:guanine nucleotide-binding protein subunit gamma 1-like isoform X2 [Phalaenopsis equestris]
MQANGEGTKAALSTAAAAIDMNPPTSADTRGKHRILAELKHLEQEARFLEDELEKLGKTEKVSAAVQELLQKIETNPEPLLPITHGPVNPSWDRWFEGPQDSRRCRCPIL